MKEISRAGQIPEKLVEYVLFSDELKQRGKGGLRTIPPRNPNRSKVERTSAKSSIEPPPRFTKARFIGNNSDIRTISLVHVTNFSVWLAVRGKSEHKLG
ncbi:hypothetical protein M1O13_02345 [Dehalococcoidia bacterium]|nr:hypothetical protein [Dehalococcoidia bacterium]